jgi:hypothetical protein
MVGMVRPEHNDGDHPRCPLTRRQVVEILQAHQEELRQFGMNEDPPLRIGRPGICRIAE